MGSFCVELYEPVFHLHLSWREKVHPRRSYSSLKTEKFQPGWKGVKDDRSVSVGVPCQFVPDRICPRTEVLVRRVPLRMCLLDDASLYEGSPYDPSLTGGGLTLFVVRLGQDCCGRRPGILMRSMFRVRFFTLCQGRKLSFCCFCSKKDRVYSFLKQNSGSKRQYPDQIKLLCFVPEFFGQNGNGLLVKKFC
jgi:hypothetical protein